MLEVLEPLIQNCKDSFLNVEVHEHNKEHGAVEYDHVAEDLGKLTVFLEQWQCSMDEEGDKLNQLHGRQVSEIVMILFYVLNQEQRLY